MPGYTKYTYITNLPSDVQKSIRLALAVKLANLGFSKKERAIFVADAMDSRLIDLEDTIDYHKYLARANAPSKTKARGKK